MSKEEKQSPERPENDEKSKDGNEWKKSAAFKLAETHHVAEIDGKPVRYTARAGYMPIRDDKWKQIANICFFSYEKDVSEKEKADRPLTFVFNGGPGCSSIWLHLGGLGPSRIQLTDEGFFTPPPCRLENNQYSWLDFTDMVFIDPVGTGYSGPEEDTDPKQFWGVKEDIESVGEFIRLYISRYKRWLSPKYIAGESYGTTRAAGLSDHIQDRLGIDLNGIVLISTVLDFRNLVTNAGNDLPYVFLVPTYAAIAWHHKKLSPALQENFEKTIREAEEWAMSEYLLALSRGYDLPQEEKERIAGKLAEFTGLSEKFILHCHLRVNPDRFRKELLRDEFRTVARMDGRMTGIDADAAGERPEYDPAFASGALNAAVNAHAREVLKYENDLLYRPIGRQVGASWNWISHAGAFPMGYANVSDSLRAAIHKNKYLQVLVGCGYYDIATPFLNAKYTVSHLRLDPSLRDNISIEYYHGGHMFYYPFEMLRKLKNDARKFYERSVKPEYRKD